MRWKTLGNVVANPYCFATLSKLARTTGESASAIIPPSNLDPDVIRAMGTPEFINVLVGALGSEEVRPAPLRVHVPCCGGCRSLKPRVASSNSRSILPPSLLWDIIGQQVRVFIIPLLHALASVETIYKTLWIRPVLAALVAAFVGGDVNAMFGVLTVLQAGPSEPLCLRL